MAPDQMGMSAPAISPDQFAVFDQMRQQLSPKEFSDEVLAGASQVDPQAVVEFKKELEAQELPPEVLDAINDMVDAILADPSRYNEIREQYLAQDMPEEMLPEQFDPQFFAALNMAVDQMIAAPAGPQAFAKGGIAELKPIAKALASYGRNGDTMLAHITPAEARMLKRRGGSGTINPDTGLPEFFLKKLFRSVGKALKSVGKAVKKFVNSSVGRLVTTVALGFFLGPAAAQFLNVTSAAGVAAVSGFVGSAGSTLLGGGNLRDALKAGVVGGLTAGAGAGIMGGAGAFQAGSYTGPTTVGGQWDKLKDMLTPGQAAAPGAAPVPAGAEAAAAPAPAGGEALATAQAPLPGTAAAPAAPTAMGPGTAPTPLGAEFKPFETTASKVMNIGSDIAQGTKNLYNRLSPSGIQQQAIPGAQTAGENAINSLMARVPDATPAMKEAAYQAAFKSAMPGVVSTYGPMIGLGLGAAGALGGFKAKQPGESPLMAEFRERDKLYGSMAENPELFYPQGLPGVRYDERGAIIGSTPWAPKATMEDIRVPAQNTAGIGGLPAFGSQAPMYTPGIGALGLSPQIAQPYNTASMYTNLMPPIGTVPRFAAEGGLMEGEAEDTIPHFATGGIFSRLFARLRERGFLGMKPAASAAAAPTTPAASAGAPASAPAPTPAAPAPGISPEEQQQQAALARRQAIAAQFAQGLRFNQAAPISPNMGPYYNLASPTGLMAAGGLASLAQGGYPRRTGQISGPGTEKSDSIPAMLSDGEFVMTAKAVRGAGNGSRRAGAKKMYALMHQLERNASRG